MIETQTGAYRRPFAVLGASGQVGAAVVDALRARGAVVRRVLRQPDTTLHSGDVVVPAWSKPVLTRAFAGCAGAFLMVPLVDDSHELGLTSHRAAEAAGLERVVRLSVLQRLAQAGLALGRLHRALDDDLHARRVHAASLCPDSFMQNLLPSLPAMRAGQLPNVTGAGRMAYIDVQDIAACAATLLCGDDVPSGRYELTGPEALSVEEIASMAGNLLGSPVHCSPQSIGDWQQELLRYGMAQPVVHMLCEVAQWTLDGHAQAPTSTVESMTGRSPTTMRQFLRRVLATA